MTFDKSLSMLDIPLIFHDSVTALDEVKKELGIVALNSLLDTQKPAFINFANIQKVSRISNEDWGISENWFVLGDIHGDFYALYNALKHIQQICPEFRLVFLGDLIDRGPHPLECLWLLLAYAKKFPKRILWIGGNHDVSIQKSLDGSFFSTVSPAEFLDELNGAETYKREGRQLGDEFIELAKDLPRAALSPDGVLFTHGGFPLTDRHPELLNKKTIEEQMDWLNSADSLQDFTWTRITSRPKRIPNRVSIGCSYGYLDFAAFCEITKDFFPISRMVNGHEHPTNGFDPHPEWKTYPALTFKGFGFANNYDDPDSFNTKYQANLIVGRCRSNDMPEVIEIPVDRKDLTNFYDVNITKFFEEANQRALKKKKPPMAETSQNLDLCNDQISPLGSFQLSPAASINSHKETGQNESTQNIKP